MTDLQARLDRAIMEARRDTLLAIHRCWNECAEIGDATTYHRHEPCDTDFDRYAALVALRARYEGFEDVSVKHRDRDDSRHHQFCPGCAAQRRRIDELTAEAARLFRGGRMTDEQRPCKHGPWAYRGDFQSGVQYCVGCDVNATTLVNAERTRADAAEAQAARLAAALDEAAEHMEHHCESRHTVGCTGATFARAALADVPDDRARRRDEAYRAMVKVLERWQAISDRLGVPDAMWDSGEWTIVRQQGRDALALARQVEEG